MKKIVSFLLALLMVFSLCACGDKTEYPSAEDGLRYILDNLKDGRQTEDVAPIVQYYFQGQELAVPDLEIAQYAYILFMDLEYEILELKQNGAEATALLRLENQNLPEAFVHFWTWRDNEYYSFSNYDMLLMDACYAAEARRTVELSLQLRYEPELAYQGETLQQEDGAAVSGWVIVCDDAVINAFLCGVLDTDYVENGHRFVVDNGTFSEIEELTGTLLDCFAAYDSGSADEAVGDKLYAAYLQARFYEKELRYCATAWDHSKTDSGAALLQVLMGCSEVYLAGDNPDVDAPGMIAVLLQQMKNA